MWEAGVRHDGSSPLARGLPLDGDDGPALAGIIPARAGFTVMCSRRSRGAPDHPRSRGVYCDWPWRERIVTGSSPLARGLQHRLRLRRVLLRIIPARAGFTPRGPPSRRSPADHPRSRGVYVSHHTQTATRQGSSPLARGLPRGSPGLPGGPGIIPARAGFTPGGPARAEPPADHPRSRGVYPKFAFSSTVRNGSSPLARGLHGSIGVRRPCWRIIPARAGFTASTTAPPRARGDHPRSRGVYWVGE